MATEVNLIDKQIAEEQQAHARRIRRLEELRIVYYFAKEMEAAFPDEVEVKNFINGRSNIEVGIVVANFKEAAKYLEYAIDAGYNFCSSKDHGWVGDRDFHSDRLTISAHLKEDGKGCRRVVTGYEAVTPQPIYEFVCED